MSADTEDIERMRRYRETNFAVEINQIRPSYQLYKDEFVVSVTHNGHQYSSMSMNADEARKIIAAIQAHLEAQVG